MRRRLVGDQRIEVAHRVADQIGVHVERDDDRHAGADLAAQCAEQVILAVVQTLGAHGAVQRQADAVDPVRRREDARLEARIGRPRHHAAGHRPGGHRGRQLDIRMSAQDIDDACERAVAERLAQRLRAPSSEEIFLGGQEGCERIRLMSERTDENAHCPLSLAHDPQRHLPRCRSVSEDAMFHPSRR